MPAPAAALLTPRTASTSKTHARVLSQQMARAGPWTGRTKYPNNPNKLSPAPTYPHTLETRKPTTTCDEQSSSRIRAARIRHALRSSHAQSAALRCAQLGRTLPRRAFGPALFAGALLASAGAAACPAASPFPAGFGASEPGAFTAGVAVPPMPMPWWSNSLCSSFCISSGCVSR